MVDETTRNDAHDGAGRLGLLGHGTYYLLLTILCARLLLGSGGNDNPGAEGAVSEVAQQPFGQVLLGALCLAFAAYATIRWIRVIAKDEWSSKAMNGLRASVWTFLTVLAARTLLGGLQGGGDGGHSGTSLTRTILEAPGGTWVVAAVGLFLGGVALYQLRQATDEAVGYELQDLGLDGRRIVRWLGRVGYFGRTISYGTVAFFVVHAAFAHDPKAGQGLDGALQAARRTPWGTWLLLAVTVGFAAFGVFRLAEARYSYDAT